MFCSYIIYLNNIAFIHKKGGVWMKRTEMIAARKRKGLTQNDLAERLEVKQCTISYIENGKKLPSLELAFKIADELEIDITVFHPEKNLKQNIA